MVVYISITTSPEDVYLKSNPSTSPARIKSGIDLVKTKILVGTLNEMV